MTSIITDSNNDNWEVTFVKQDNNVITFECVNQSDVMTLHLNSDGSFYGAEYNYYQISHDENLQQLDTLIFNWYSSL